MESATLSRPVFGQGTPPATGAMLSEDGIYRYRLWRIWDDAKPMAVWIMLNPSTADASRDDPTIRRCIGFSRAFDFGGMEIVNLYALRATNPATLRTVADPTGPNNDEHIRRACSGIGAGRVICAWGASVYALHRASAVRQLIWHEVGQPWCLGKTKDGSPFHPLYRPNSTRLEQF